MTSLVDIYAEPKFIKKKRKKELKEEEGIGNSIWNSTKTINNDNDNDDRNDNDNESSSSIKRIISSIVPLPIQNYDRNFQDKISGRHLALNPSKSSSSPLSKNPTQSDRNLSKKGPTLRQVKYLELEELIKMEQRRYKYENFIPLHKLWLGYMSELLEVPLMTDWEITSEKQTDLHTHLEDNTSMTMAAEFTAMRLPNMSNIQSKLLKADFHGAYLSVQKAKNPALVGLNGLVFLESELTFKLISRDNSIKVIPKKHCIFKIQLPLLLLNNNNNKNKVEEKENCYHHDHHYLTINLFGNNFIFRPTDRINKKFKSKSFFEL